MFDRGNQFFFGRLVTTDRLHTQSFHMDKDDFFFLMSGREEDNLCEQVKGNVE